ncbi:uncharacterized protein PAC_12667 [Phialocephala subalpina]|uniref:Uncharacterized protein n=1 Tax=Phialocephala subalpina TaxID=576137 RepID=A0A1L7XCJ9_9HELO|nr:uncharacterized protein PAC_12667 [Phialocephala subalpina]
MSDCLAPQEQNGEVPKLLTHPTPPISDSEDPASTRNHHKTTSKDTNLAVVSTWAIGRKTPIMMIASYLLAIVIAVTHFLFCWYLSGRPADGPYPHVPQTYSTTASILMANSFGLLLRISLSLAFTQHLWHILRTTLLRISTIEQLFIMRSDPLSLFNTTVLQKAWPLVLITALLWSIPVAVSFPPGALTIIPSSHSNIVTEALVPTFNASDVGNGTFDYILQHSLAAFSIQSFGDDPNPYLGVMSMNPTIQYLVERTLINNEIWTMPSPCGANCSYALKFTGPYLQCTNSNRDSTLYSNSTEEALAEPSAFFTVYNGSWVYPLDVTLADTPNTFANVSAYLNITSATANTLGVEVVSSDRDFEDRNYRLNITQNNLVCIPSRAEYEVHIVYEDNIVTLKPSIGVESVYPLTDVMDPMPMSESFLFSNTAPSELNPSQVTYIQDANLMALIGRTAERLSGLSTALVVNASEVPLTVDSEGFQWYNVTSNPLDGPTLSNYSVDIENTLAPFTPLCNFFNPSNDYTCSVNQSILNFILANITLSTISSYNIWSTYVNETQTIWVNTYSFSRPRNLIIPYCLALLCTLPLIILGLYALYTNGVPATDGGFLQLLTTTRGSATLDETAVGGCLGGDKNVPSALKDLKIKYGELTGMPLELGHNKSVRPRRAGFGTEGEVSLLRRDYIYGG